MRLFALILLVAAFVLFVLDAFINPPSKVRLTPLGLACLTLAQLVMRWPALV